MKLIVFSVCDSGFRSPFADEVGGEFHLRYREGQTSGRRANGASQRQSQVPPRSVQVLAGIAKARSGSTQSQHVPAEDFQSMRSRTRQRVAGEEQRSVGQDFPFLSAAAAAHDASFIQCCCSGVDAQRRRRFFCCCGVELVGVANSGAAGGQADDELSGGESVSSGGTGRYRRRHCSPVYPSRWSR